MVDKNAKDMTQHLKTFKGQGINGMKIKLNGFNKRLREQIKTRAYINDTNEAILEHYRIFAKK